MKIWKKTFFLSLAKKIWIRIRISLKSGMRTRIRIKTFWIRHTGRNSTVHEFLDLQYCSSKVISSFCGLRVHRTRARLCYFSPFLHFHSSSFFPFSFVILSLPLHSPFLLPLPLPREVLLEATVNAFPPPPPSFISKLGGKVIGSNGSITSHYFPD